MYKRVVVGVSGGSDSMAMLHYLVQKMDRVIAVHVNYHLRDTADRDQHAVEQLCSDLNVKLKVFDYDQTHRGNFQKAARDFRYAAMVQTAYHYDCEAVAVAHHKDDAWETYIMQKKSGRSSRISGLKEDARIFGMPVWRPFFEMRKEELIAYCAMHHIVYYDDESNASFAYSRNEIRHALSLLSHEELNQINNEMHDDQRVLDIHYGKIDKMLQTIGDTILLDVYRAIPDGYRLDFLRQWIWDCGVRNYNPSYNQLSDFDTKIMAGTLNDWIGYKKICSSYHEIQIFEPISYSYVMNTLDEFQAVHFRLQSMGSRIEGLTLTESDFPIVIRTPKKGDMISLRFGTKNVNRFFIDRKISHNLRHCWPLVENAVKEVIFVSGIGCDIRHFSNNPTVFVVKL